MKFTLPNEAWHLPVSDKFTIFFRILPNSDATESPENLLGCQTWPSWPKSHSHSGSFFAFLFVFLFIFLFSSFSSFQALFSSLVVDPTLGSFRTSSWWQEQVPWWSSGWGSTLQRRGLGFNSWLGNQYPTCRGATKPIHSNYWNTCALEPMSHS